MPAPITPSRFESAIPANNANLCDRFSAFLNLPLWLSQLFSWMFTSSGDVSAEFKNEIAISVTPPGTYAFSAAADMGDQWLLCNGQEVSRTDYANLFAAIGTTYGAGDGSTTFAVPNGARRSLIATGGSWQAGDQVGEENHTMTTAELVAHTHNFNGPVVRTEEKGDGANNVWRGSQTEATSSTGSSAPFNVVHPCLVAYLFIHI